MAETSRTILVDDHPSCYDIALTRGWARKMMSVKNMTPQLDEAVFDFVAELRSVAHAARLPHDMLRSLESFHNGYVRANPLDSPVEKIAGAFVVKVGRSIPGLTVEQLNTVRGLCLEVGNSLANLRDDPRLDFPFAEAWSGMTATVQFRMQLWGLQRTCYVAIYNAYDSFLIRCISLALKDPCFRRKSPEKFAEKAIMALGQDGFDLYCDDEGIKRAGLIRHAISHAAGRKTKDLKDAGHVDRTPDGRVQTTATDVRGLLRLVEDRGYKLTELVAAKLTRQRPR